MINGKKIGLVMGAGGARGLTHLGVLKVLKEENIEPDMVVGVSMGAIIGGAYVLGITIEEIEAIALNLNKKRAIAKLLDLASPNKAILKGDKAYNFLNTVYKNANFSDAKIPFRAVATELETGKEAVFKRGNMAQAVRASMSLPGIFKPVKIGSKYFIDGGVVNPTPTDVVGLMGADVIIAIDLVMKRDVKLEDPSIVATLLQSYEIIRTQAVKYKLKNSNSKTILIKPKVRGAIDSFKFSEIPQFIKAGEEAGREHMPLIKEKLGIK